MDGALWLRIVDIFHAAVERPQEEQAAFVVTASDGNSEIEREVLAMLDEDRRGVSRLQRGVAEVAEQLLGGSHGSPPFVPPERIGPYVRKEFLGRGGMGAVWKAVRIDTGQPMAIKFLLPMNETSAFLRKRFADEINTLARLRHPHIVSFHDAGVLDHGTPWFVMDYVDEYVRGMRFTTYCRLPGRSLNDKLRVFRTVCEAVLYAHRQGIIHRDLKPSNILTARDGSPRIVDFGIARQLMDTRESLDFTSPSLRMMSLDYAAPEWKELGQVGVYTDVYSLGVILYEILTGKHPYSKGARTSRPAGDEIHKLPEKPSAAIAEAASAGDEMKLSRSAWKDLDKLCLAAMHPDPQQRYATVESLVRDVDHYLNNEPLEIQPPSLIYQVGKFVRRNMQQVLLAAAVTTLLFAMAAFFTWRLAKERNLALEQAARARHLQGFMTNLLQGGDQEAGPAANLKVATMIDRGVQEAGSLRDDPLVQADLYQTLGTMSQRLGRLHRADTLLLKALDERRSLKQPDVSGIASNQFALGLVYADEGKARAGEQIIRTAMTDLQHHGSPDKSLLGQGQLALGTAMVAAGQQKQAAGVLDRAIATLQQAYGPRSPELALAYGKLADAQVYMANYDAADALNRKALAIDRAVFGEDYPHVADDLGNLAQSLEVRGYYSQAESLEREALAIMEKWYGPDHPETARKLTTLASTLSYEGKNKEAGGLLQRALTIQERVYGPSHPHVAYVLNVMGSVALDSKEFPVAEKDFSRVADIYRQAYGGGDYRVAVALGNLASVYQAEGHYAKCETLLLDVVGRFTRAVGAGNVNTGMAQVRLGRTLRFEKKYAESVQHSLAGYQVLVKRLNPNSGWLSGARHDLIIDYMALGEPQKAEQFRVEVATAAVTNPK